LKNSRAAINAIEGGSLRFDVAACEVVVSPAKGSILKRLKNAALENLESGAAK